LAFCEERVGNLLWAKGEQGLAASYFDRARSLWTEVTNPRGAGRDSPERLNDFARFLATCPAEQFRDVNRAVTLARRGVDRAPARGLYWSTLGLTLYRFGDARAATTAFEKARELRHGQDPGDGFFQALAYARLGEPSRAREYYAQAAAFMEKHQPGDEHLRRLRSEAARQLGLGEATPPDFGGKVDRSGD